MTDAGADGAPRALILVRNTVIHDARILREAETLHGLGYDVLIAGVVSTAERQRELEIDGTRVLRLDPAGGLRSAVRRLLPARRGPAPDGAGTARRADGAPGAGGRQVDAVGPAPAPPAPGGRSRLRRLAVTAAYYAQGLALVRRTSPTLVHANDYNTMWIGLGAKLLRHSRLIYDSHELWPDRNGRPEWRPWLLASEALFVRAADLTLTTSPGYAGAIARRYHVPPPTVVRNIPARVGQAPAARRQAPADGALAIYVGGLMPGRGLELAIRALAQAPGVRARLIGPGSERYRAALRAEAASAGVANRVELRDPVPPGALLRELADADLGLMLIEPICRSYELTLPNKLFEYAAAALPILSSDLPVIGRLVREHGIGEVVALEPGAIARGMQRLVQPEVGAHARERARALAERETWEREQARLASLYQGLQLRR